MEFTQRCFVKIAMTELGKKHLSILSTGVTNLYVMDSIQSLIGTIKTLVNSLRHTISKSTFVLKFLVSIARTTGMNTSVERQGIAN